MKLFLSISVFLAFASCANKKAAIVDELKSLNTQIDQVSYDFDKWNDSIDAYVKLQHDTLFFDTSKTWRGLVDSAADAGFKRSVLRKAYDSLEWELKKY